MCRVQEFRDLIGESENKFILSFLADTNHIAQELTNWGNDPRKVFDSVLPDRADPRATTARFFMQTTETCRYRKDNSVLLPAPAAAASM